MVEFGDPLDPGISKKDVVFLWKGLTGADNRKSEPWMVLDPFGNSLYHKGPWLTGENPSIPPRSFQEVSHLGPDIHPSQRTTLNIPLYNLFGGIGFPTHSNPTVEKGEPSPNLQIPPTSRCLDLAPATVPPSQKVTTGVWGIGPMDPLIHLLALWILPRQTSC